MRRSERVCVKMMILTAENVRELFLREAKNLEEAQKLLQFADDDDEESERRFNEELIEEIRARERLQWRIVQGLRDLLIFLEKFDAVVVVLAH